MYNTPVTTFVVGIIRLHEGVFHRETISRVVKKTFVEKEGGSVQSPRSNTFFVVVVVGKFASNLARKNSLPGGGGSFRSYPAIVAPLPNTHL